MGATEETLKLLRSIDASLKTLVARSTPAVTPLIADDRDLDGQYGDPVLKFMPRDWTGPNYKERHFSECPAELLVLVAESLEYFAEQADKKGETTSSGKPVSAYKRKDAARARGWARRVREGRVPQHAGAGDFGGGGDFDSGF